MRKIGDHAVRGDMGHRGRRLAGLVAVLLIPVFQSIGPGARPAHADSPPAPFLWGAATSSYQVEGGIRCAQPSGGPAFTSFMQAQIPGVPCNDFDFFNGNTGIQDRVRANSKLVGPEIDLAPAGQADNFWDPAVYRRDFDNARMLGLNSFRISLEWSRIEPQQGVFDQGAINGYVQMLKEMRLRGLTPVVTLNHFTLPIWALMPPQSRLPYLSPQPDPGFQSSLQGWENPALVDAFVDYVNHVVPAMKDQVGIWLTLNEPVLSQLVVGYFAGVWSPGFLLAGDRIKKALPNLISAHVRAYDAIKAIYGATPVRVGFAHAMAAVVPAAPNIPPRRSQLRLLRQRLLRQCSR